MASLTIFEMRNFVKSAYPNPSWCYKVDHMPNYQVMAIYQRLILKEKQKQEKPEEEYHQMTIFEAFGKVY